MNIEGNTFNNVDVVKMTGAQTAITLRVTQAVVDGFASISLTNSVPQIDNPKISGIEIKQTLSSPTPVSSPVAPPVAPVAPPVLAPVASPVAPPVTVPTNTPPTPTVPTFQDILINCGGTLLRYHWLLVLVKSPTYPLTRSLTSSFLRWRLPREFRLEDVGCGQVLYGRLGLQRHLESNS
jgi:hypothetical protein